jgi:hypothetical protein
VRQHASIGLFLAFHLLALYKKLDSDFLCSSSKNSTLLVWPCLWRRAHPCGNNVAK